MTCSDDCHEKLVNRLEREFGRFKKVVDLETGKAHKVSTREIIEKGLKQQDLKNHPEWREGEDSKWDYSRTRARGPIIAKRRLT